jgi:tungstate transport system ATP-binding protein
MNADPILSVSGLCVRRPGGFSLRVDQLTVARHEVLTLLGPNGAGKSTLLQALALLEPPQDGTLLLDGTAVSTRSLAARRKTAVVLQEPLLLRGSVRDNVALGLRLHGLGRRERDERVTRWMRRTGIEHLARRAARSLSGGEQRRVSLARALALEPLVLFLDEPFAALDAPTRRSLLADLRGWLTDAGCATILVTHDRDEALHLADRVAVLIDGRLRQCGPVDDVFDHPADAAVASFLGIDNILEVEVLGAEGATHTRLRAGSVQLIGAGSVPAGPALLALHPEKIALFHPDEPIRPDLRNRLPGRVISIEPAGSEVRIRLDVGVPLSALLPRAAAADRALQSGAAIVAAIRPASLHVMRRTSPPAPPLAGGEVRGPGPASVRGV